MLYSKFKEITYKISRKFILSGVLFFSILIIASGLFFKFQAPRQLISEVIKGYPAYAQSVCEANSSNPFLKSSIAVSYIPGVEWANGTVQSCCSNSSDCVDKNGKCFASGNNVNKLGMYSDLNPGGNDNKAFCWQYGGGTGGTWLDCDRWSSAYCSSPAVCGKEGGGVLSGENMAFGEYTSLGQSGCCGDDSGEYYITQCSSVGCTPKCCDSAIDVISSNGICYNNEDGSLPDAAEGTVEKIATYTGNGLVLNYVVLNDSTYISIGYAHNKTSVIRVNNITGKIEKHFQSEAFTDQGDNGMIIGPDNNIYLGGYPTGHLLRINTNLDANKETIDDLGAVDTATTTWIYGLAWGSDGKLYGGSYPNAKLFSYDPVTSKITDIGRIEPTESYVHFIAAGKDGYVYAGVGSTRQKVVAYKIADGTYRTILDYPATVNEQFGRVYQTSKDGGITSDGGVAAQIEILTNGSATKKYFSLKDGVATEIAFADFKTSSAGRIYNGKYLGIDNIKSEIGYYSTVENKVISVSFEKERPTKEVMLQRLIVGQDKKLYSGTYVSGFFFKVDPDTKQIIEVGNSNFGQIYSYLLYGESSLLGASYFGGRLLIFDTSKAVNTNLSSPLLNPAPGLKSDQGTNIPIAWRPRGMVYGDDGLVYIGAVGGYGKLGGTFSVWNPDTKEITVYENIISNQAVISLTNWNGKIIGGTSIRGGEGSTATPNTSAKIFIWDPIAKAISYTSSELSNTSEIKSLVTTPDGKVYGTAVEMGGFYTKIFQFDPATHEITFLNNIPVLRGAPDSALKVGPDGRIWGLASNGVFAIDPRNNSYSIKVIGEGTINGGFDISDGYIYYFLKGTISRYKIPGITVITPNVTASCSPNTTSAITGTRVNWSVQASGGNGIFTYFWTGTDGLAGTVATINKDYSSSGAKTASVTVTSGSLSMHLNCGLMNITSDTGGGGGGGGGGSASVTPTGLYGVPLSLLVNNGATSTNSSVLDITMNGDPATVSGYAISLNSNFTNVSVLPHKSKISFALPQINGQYTIYLKYYSTSGIASLVLSKTITLKDQENIDNATTTQGVVDDIDSSIINADGSITVYTPVFRDYIKTTDSSAIYYIDADLKKHLYPNLVTFRTWESASWSKLTANNKLKVISQSEFDNIEIADNVTAKPGANLIKFSNSPRMYKVVSMGKLKLVDANEAKALFGTKYATKIITVQNSFEGDYAKE